MVATTVWRRRSIVFSKVTDSVIRLNSRAPKSGWKRPSYDETSKRKSPLSAGAGALGGKCEKNVKYLFKDPVNGYGDTTFTTTHDTPHATDLLKGDGAGAISGNYVHGVVHVTAKSVYSHFSRSPHHCRGLCSLAADWGVEQQQLHYLFEIRFVASEVLVLSHFITDLPAVVMYLRDEKDNADTSAEMKAKIIGWLRIITQFKFVAMMITQLDIDLALNSFSVATQSDSLLVINYPDVRNDFKTRLKDLVTSLGYNWNARLAELSKGELRATVTKKIAKRVVSGDSGVRRRTRSSAATSRPTTTAPSTASSSSSSRTHRRVRLRRKRGCSSTRAPTSGRCSLDSTRGS